MCDVASIFGSPKTPDVITPPPTPKSSDADVEAAAQKERELSRKRKNRKATILTQLATDSDGNKTLLGM